MAGFSKLNYRRLYDGGNEKTHEYVCSRNGQDARSW